MPESVQTPIVVSPQSMSAVLLTGLRHVAVLAGGVAAIGGFVSRRDLAGLIAFVQSDAIVPIAGAAAALGAAGYSLWKTWSNKQKLIVVAEAAPNSVAIVTAKEPTL